MAALLLSVVGSSVGTALFGSGGAGFGCLVGSLAGNLIDRSLFGGGNVQRSVEGPRLSDLDIMASTEGPPIARVCGRVRLSGELIWATRLEGGLRRLLADLLERDRHGENYPGGKRTQRRVASPVPERRILSPYAPYNPHSSQVHALAPMTPPCFARSQSQFFCSASPRRASPLPISAPA
jgi:hypothetical protein